MDDSGAHWRTGYVQVYTGDGKGKTTAALGLALRAVGAGLRVFLGQFLKGVRASEHQTLERLSDAITVTQYGRENFVMGNPTPEDVRAAREGLLECAKIIATGEYDVVILDEANVAVHYGLFSADELLDAIDAKPEHVELLITGRNADPRIIERADLVTDMHEIKHYYHDSVPPRTGIEE